jgi:hypothetical protein
LFGELNLNQRRLPGLKVYFFLKKVRSFDALVDIEAPLVQGWESHILKLI